MSDGGHEAADIDIQSACNNRCATMNIFQHVGWALPIRSTFRYSLKQKIVLYEYFMKGEENGKKMSADLVAKLLRNKLRTFEYLKERQIKSLFSRWSKLFREGKLKPPTEQENKTEDEEPETEENEDYAEVKEETIRITNLMSWSKDDWVAVEYEGEWYPGVVNEVDNLITVKSMSFPSLGKNCFKWPTCDDVLQYEPDDILCKITPPKPMSSRFFGLSDEDFREVNAQFNVRKANKQ